MEFIVIGAEHSFGEIKDDKGKTTKYNNIVLYLADYFNENGCVGFTYPKKAENTILKIRTVEFEEIVGIKPVVFLKNFAKKFLYHKVRALYTRNKFGRNDIACVNFSKDDCFKLWERELEEEACALNYDEDDQDPDLAYGGSSVTGIEDTISGNFMELDDLSSDELAAENPVSDVSVNDMNFVDTETGEVKLEIPEDKKKGFKNPFVRNK